jgi:dimethylargininase
MHHFHHAIVRPPCSSYPQGLTTAGLGVPDLNLALRQHRAYCEALEQCGLNITRLEPDPRYPDSTFIEDTAVITSHRAILTHPGAPSRRGEVDSVGQALEQYYSVLQAIQPPGTLDGGDICHVGDHFFIGISDRTNAAGARQLAKFLDSDGFTSSIVDIRGSELLHLKSGIAYLGDKRLIMVVGMERLGDFSDFEVIPVDKQEQYAANCVRVNDYVLLSAGFPKIAARLSAMGYKTITLEMFEFQKMDGGLSCLSLRF